MMKQFKPDGCDARETDRDTVTDMADCLDRFFEMLDRNKRPRPDPMHAKGREIKDKLAERMQREP